MMQRIDNSANGSTVEQIGLEIQRVLNELDQERRTHPVLRNGSDLLNWELEVKKLTDRLQGLIIAQGIQQQVDQPTSKQEAHQLAQSGRKKNA